MFRKFRYCIIGLIAGLIGMAVGMAGQVYIYEFSDRNDVLMQAARVFKELDELAFLVAFCSAVIFLISCVVLEYRRWRRRKKRDEAVRDI